MTEKKEMGEMTQEELVAELEGARTQLKKVNTESADRRKKLEAFEKEQDDLKKKSLSDTEKSAEELKAITKSFHTLQNQLKTEKVRSAVLEEATKLGFTNPGDAFSLIDQTKIEIADDGKVSGFEESLKVLAESGRLVMTADEGKGQRFGTPPLKGKQTKKPGVEQIAPSIRI